jgi:hypothetical protein
MNTNLVHQAICIVLQQLMRFDLGWNEHFILQRRHSLGDEIISDKKRQSHVGEDRDGELENLVQHLKHEVGYVDDQWITSLASELRLIQAESLLPNIVDLVSQVTMFR